MKWFVLPARVGSFWRPSPTMSLAPLCLTQSVSTIRWTRFWPAHASSSSVSAGRPRYVGEGNNSIGDIVPSTFAERDLVDVCVYLNDKADILLPPYNSPAERATLEERADFKHRGFCSGWTREDTRRYFLAGGGHEGEFEALYLVAIDGSDKIDKAIADRTYAGREGAGIGYLIAGRKPGLHTA